MASVIPTPIPALPPAPQPTDDRTTFSTKAFATVAAWEPHRVAVNTTATETYQNALEAKDQADRATDEADRAEGEADRAETARTGAEAALASAEAIANTTFWVSGATYAKGDVVWSLAVPGTRYVRLIAGAGTTDPYADAVNWAQIGAGEKLQTVAMTTSMAALTGYAYVMTTAGITLTMPATPVANDRISFTNASSGDCYVQWNGKTVKGVSPSPAAMKLPRYGSAQVMWSETADTWTEV